MFRTGSFIQDQHLGVLHQSPSKGNQRTLSNRQIAPLVLNNGIEVEPSGSGAPLLSSLRRILFRVLHKVRPLECVPESSVVELIERIQIGSQRAREQELQIPIDERRGQKKDRKKNIPDPEE